MLHEPCQKSGVLGPIPSPYLLYTAAQLLRSRLNTQAMFFFNKTNASLPYRQSSANSHVADPSATDSWVSPYSDSSTYGDMPSPEQRERGVLGKRSSVFTLRSRSNTATPANSSFLSHTSTITSTDSSSRRSSQDIRSLTDSQVSPSEISGPKRSLFSRGKRLRRQSSQLSSASVSDDIEEVDTGKRSSVLRKNRYRRGGYGSQGSSECFWLMLVHI